jgi:hypothetical protein
VVARDLADALDLVSERAHSLAHSLGVLLPLDARRHRMLAGVAGGRAKTPRKQAAVRKSGRKGGSRKKVMFVKKSEVVKE